MKQIWVCGIDLGGKTRQTTGVCFLKIVKGKPKFDRRKCNFCRVIQGKNLADYLQKYLPQTKVIAIDAPLTLGPGKGKMRLWEKFFSTKPCQNEDQKDAFICTLIAAWHLQGQTFGLGYRDGRLWLPDFHYWKKEWRDRFLSWWHRKHPFKYKFLKIGGHTFRLTGVRPVVS